MHVHNLGLQCCCQGWQSGPLDLEDLFSPQIKAQPLPSREWDRAGTDRALALPTQLICPILLPVVAGESLAGCCACQVGRPAGGAEWLRKRPAWACVCPLHCPRTKLRTRTRGKSKRGWPVDPSPLEKHMIRCRACGHPGQCRSSESQW